MAAQKPSIEDLLLHYVDGFPIIKHQAFNPEHTKEAMEYEPRNGDVILFGYPKTGSSWIMYMVWSILNDCKESLNDLKDILIVEMHGKDVIDDLPDPRFYKIHLPADRIRMSNKAKYVYVHRNPADVLISSYHFFQKVQKTDCDFDSYFDAFIDGRVPFGNVFDHVLAAYKHKDDENFLMICYEEAKKDPLDTVMKLARFLGNQYMEKLEKDTTLAQKIVQMTSFERMKSNVKFSDPTGSEGPEHMEFYYRKGVVGDGYANLSDEHKKRLESEIRKRMEGTGFVKLWLNSK